MIDFDFLHEILKYEPDTGNFIWIKPRPRIRVGEIAGSIHPRDGYRYIGIKGRTYSQHRLAWFYMTGDWPKYELDHIDMVRTNNRWCNLREATKSQNLGNTRNRPNKYGFRGITRDRYGKWIAQIGFNGRKICIGLFETKEAAHAAYVEKQKELYGEFARCA